MKRLMKSASFLWEEEEERTSTTIKQKKTYSNQRLKYKSYSRRGRAERRKWNREEDKQLAMLINKHGTSNWRVVASLLQDRTAKQCRERWINHLDPAIIKGKLSSEEWSIVVQTQEELGNRWSEIAKLLPGRTPNQIKNVWHAMARRETQKKPKRKLSILTPITENLHFSTGDDQEDEESNSDDLSSENAGEDLLPEVVSRAPKRKISAEKFTKMVSETANFPEDEDEDDGEGSDTMLENYSEEKLQSSGDTQKNLSKLEALVEIALDELDDDLDVGYNQETVSGKMGFHAQSWHVLEV